MLSVLCSIRKDLAQICIHLQFCAMLYLIFDVDFAFFSGWILSRWTINGSFHRFTQLLNALTSSADITLLLTALCHHACQRVAAVCCECFIGVLGICWGIYLHNGRSFMRGFIGRRLTASRCNMYDSKTGGHLRLLHINFDLACNY